ncbi:ABC transporter ATP-binding protein [Metabacillus arenae]|uniref:ABC transporter ATP-binding protein n=1 Tax=Metabacillus arenae TaxID=2771434 RepID=A0A926NGG0_9BACI|nr:ABC transporter ATP-binding protein [Metabacillus arenae]MBD1380635.1 ABC transporter ATP-binding protein [Metabacillus arenae]
MSLVIQDVSKRFGNFTAVNNLSLTVEEGQMFGMLGANGAGKTTTFRMTLGLLTPSEGEITWKGKKLGYKNSSLVGYLPEERGLYPKLKVADQLHFFGRLRGMKKKEIRKEIEDWLEKFQISDYRNKAIEELSKGNQQKIQFIASVLHKPELLILDEPFSGLDPVNVNLLKDEVTKLKEAGTTIVFSSHRMEHVEELCEKLCIMHHGSPVVLGKLKDIKRSHKVKHIVIHADFETSFLKSVPGVIHYKETVDSTRIQVADETVAKQIFQQVAQKGFVNKFEVEEPTLNDIFIEKVGKASA